MVRPRTPTRSIRNLPAQSRQRHEPTHHPSDSSVETMLVDLIEQQEFEAAVARVREMPSEASINIASAAGAHNSIMGQGNLALHEACKNQPPIELIDALLEANENAVHTKGQWGYLPLHFACCSRASPEVVARLIVTYPSATRTKDDHEGFLPLHLAAKWGADDEVIMALLTVHPKASSVRDLAGKTPIEHAATLSSPHVREAVVTALRRAPILCAVSKAAMNKLAYESDAKLREVCEVYQERMTEVKDKYEQDKTNAVALEVQLRKELWDEKQRSAHLSEKVVMLERQLEDKDRAAEERELVLEEIEDLISGRRKPKVQVEALKEQQEIERREQEKRNREIEQQRLAKSAVREFLSAGNHTPEQSSDDDFDERREPPPSTTSGRSTASPRAAAVATVKEWFSSDTNQLRGHNTSNGTNMNNQHDKIEQYRQPASQQTQQRQDQAHTQSNVAVTAMRGPKYASDQQQAKASSLLSRSKSAPRSSAALARRDYRKLSDLRPKSPRFDLQPNTSSQSTQHHQKQFSASPPAHQEYGHERSGSNSGSSRYTQAHGNSAYKAHRSTQSNSSSSRRPRESYSTVKAPTSAYSHRIMDDANESLTMDSNIDWE